MRVASFVLLILTAATLVYGYKIKSMLPRRQFFIGAGASLVGTPVLSSTAAMFIKSRSDRYPVQEENWLDILSSGQYFVLRQGGTEPPNSSPLVGEKRRGVYVCAGCVAPLFDSTRKFDSGTGWPSFAAARSNAVETLPSLANLLGEEVRCRQCGGHLGDLFSDGDKFPGTAAEESGKRYCIDGAALVFAPSDPDFGPVVGDGLTGRKRLI